MAQYLASIIKNYTASYSGLSKTSWEGIGLSFISATSIGVCFFLSLYFVDVLHFQIATAGLIISFYGFGTALGGIVGGKLSDKISPRAISITSLILESVAFYMLTRLKLPQLLMCNLFVLGFASYGFKTSNNVWVLNHCKDGSAERLKTINIIYAAANLGFGLSGVIISFFSSYGYENIFNLSALLLLFCAIYLSFRKEQTPMTKELIETLNPKSQNAIDINKQNKKVVGLILVCLFSVGLIIAQLGTTYPIYLQTSFPHLGVKAVSILFILDSVLIVLFQAPLVSLVGGYNKILIVGIGAFLMGLGMVALSLSFAFIMAIFSCVIWTSGEMLFMSMAQLVCYEKGGKNKKGYAMGLYQTTYATSVIIGPIFGGTIYQLWGGNVLWYISGMIGLSCLSACIFFKNYD